MEDNTIMQHVVTIKIAGIGTLQTYTSLSIQQGLADVCYGSFGYREEGETTLQHQVDFYKKLMGQELEIALSNAQSFKGYITTVSLENEDHEASEYKIGFSGLLGKIAYHQECASWLDRTLNEIIKDAAPGGLIETGDNDTESLKYTVQYNQSDFDFIKMMATRHGKWLYYDGEKMKMKSPSGSPIVFQKTLSIFHISILARNSIGHDQVTGFNVNTGKNIAVSLPQGNYGGMLEAAAGGARTAYGDQKTSLFNAGIRDEAHAKELGKLHNESAASSSVIFQAVTYNTSVKLGSIIQIDEENGAIGKTYIVTQIMHSSANPDNYVNYLNFIPSDVVVPPYTDPNAKIFSSPQPAIVKDNEDEGGKDRLRVNFPWMTANTTTDWISMVTPYAGKNKGMRFLPEKEEEVLVDFLGGNIEKPYVVGAIYTDANRSTIPVGGNHVKRIGTASGRRFEINDKAGHILMYDNYTEETPKNALLMKRNKDEMQTTLESQKDVDNYSVLILNNEEYLGLGLVSDGALIAEIRMEKEGKKMTIKSEGSIEMTAKDSISLSAGSISINASQDLKIGGDKKGTTISGKKIEMSATSDTTIKGINVTVEATANLKASGMITTITGTPVKIN